MFRLSERLKNLGVHIGTQGLTPPKTTSSATIETIIPGVTLQNIFGEVYAVETRFPISHQHGRINLKPRRLPEILAAWAKLSSAADLKTTDFVFLDVETTALNLGSGTVAFLIAAGKYDNDELILFQFFLRNPAEEPAQLTALTEFIGNRNALVSFNGKSFDVPILETRYLLNQLGMPLKHTQHLDLLPLARCLWRERLPSRTLINLENQILGFQRTNEDIPSWVIPQLYIDYLRTGDARLIKSVFYHNAKDVLSMVGLLNYMCDLLSSGEPMIGENTSALDLVGVGKLHESLGNWCQASQLYRTSLKFGLPTSLQIRLSEKLALFHKKNEQWSEAIDLWEQAAQAGSINAHIEMAKYYEHHARNYVVAIEWTEKAMAILSKNNFDLNYSPTVQVELGHRLTRLKSKLDK